MQISYTPPPTIRDFIADYRPSELFYDWIVGPVGSGKTTGIFFKLCYMASLQKPGPDGIRRTRAVVVRNTLPQLRDTTLSSWNYWFKPGQAGEWRASEWKFILKFNDVECEVLFRPLDTEQDIARVLSLEVTFAIVDEFVQIPRQIIDALSARCGRYPSMIMGGATNWGMWGSSNPSTEDNWWHDHLHNAEINIQPGEKVPTITSSLTDNTAAREAAAALGVSVNGSRNSRYFLQPSGFSEEAENVENLPGGRDYYTNQAKGKSESWINQFLKAMWGFSVAGKAVVSTFRSELHLSKTRLRYNDQLPLIGGYDPGLGGSALIIGQEDLDGRLLVLGELVQQGYGTIRFLGEKFKPYIRRHFPTLNPEDFVFVPDPAASNRTGNDEKTIVETIRKSYKVSVESNNRLPLRLDAIEHYTTKLIGGRPAVLIDEAMCPILVRALKGGWRYKLDKNEDVKGDEPEKNLYSHPGDGFGYFCRYFHRQASKNERYERSAPRAPVMGRYGARAYHAR